MNRCYHIVIKSTFTKKGDRFLYLGGTKEADGLQVLHAVSVLRIDPFEQINLFLQNLRVGVYYTHYTGLKQDKTNKFYSATLDIINDSLQTPGFTNTL